MKHSLRSITIFLMLTILAGCTVSPQATTPDIEKDFQKLIRITNMNESIQLKVRSNESAFTSGVDIPLVINNTSSLSVFFPVDSYIKLFTTNDTEWVEVKNGSTYSGMLVISPQGTPLLDYAFTGVLPMLNNQPQETAEKELLRIVVTGELMENDTHTGEFVGAFVDVYITP